MVVECRNTAKEFYYSDYKKHSLRERFVQLVKRNYHRFPPIFTLQEFNLRVHRGESIALIGSNGSGKSTVFRLIAGILEPSKGSVKTVGRVGAVIELGAGFHRELTGAENVELYGAILGITRKNLKSQYDEIVEFSEIGDFIAIPIKYYSSGMLARLAFSVAICTNPDLLVLDEVLAVGDQSFQKKCLNRLHLFQAKGGTLMVSSHDLHLIRELCSRALLLNKGYVCMEGEIGDVVEAYLSGNF